MRGILISTNWKGKTYDSILDIVNQVTKMVHYEPVKVTINIPVCAKVIINRIVRYHCFLDSIVTN